MSPAAVPLCTHTHTIHQSINGPPPPLQGSLHTRYVGPEEQALGKDSVLKDLNFCNRHEGTDRWVGG